MAAAESTARTVALHPLAIVGVSDHFTRVSVGGSRQGAGSPVVGLLFGMQRGLEVDLGQVRRRDAKGGEGERHRGGAQKR